MKLADLTKPQWDAAQHAAQCLMQSDPNNADGRAVYRTAVVVLLALLPDDADAREIVMEAARWQMRNDIAAALAGMPAERFAA